jgi:hypothetical protein
MYGLPGGDKRWIMACIWATMRPVVAASDFLLSSHSAIRSSSGGENISGNHCFMPNDSCFIHGVKDCPFCNQTRTHLPVAPTPLPKATSNLSNTSLVVVASVCILPLLVIVVVSQSPNLKADDFFGLACGLSCVVIPALIIVGGLIAASNAEQVKKKAFEEYQKGLSRLRENPTNPEIRQEALRLGRVYSHLMRDAKGTTTFDEVAVKNDIDAACAGSVHVQNRSIEGRLAKLEQMRADGLIDGQEYQRRRQAIIDEI